MITAALMPVEYVVIVDWHVSLLELYAPEIEGATNMFRVLLFNGEIPVLDDFLSQMTFNFRRLVILFDVLDPIPGIIHTSFN